MSENLLTIRYIPLSQAVLFDGNPKLHDIGGLVESFQRYGFKEAVRWEPTLNGGSGGIVAGNGRITALQMMQQRGSEPPRGIQQDQGEWLVPVLFGVDAESEAQAQAYCVDSNSLVVTGGDLGFGEIMALYDKEQMAAIAALATEPMVTFDAEALSIIAGNKPEKEVGGLQRWAFVVEFEDDGSLLEELEDLMGMYFMPRSKRKLMPEFFAAMVRSYCASQPVVIVE